MKIKYSIHRSDKKIGTTEEVEDQLAQRYIDTGMATRVDEAAEPATASAAAEPAPVATTDADAAAVGAWLTAEKEYTDSLAEPVAPVKTTGAAKPKASG